MNICFNLNFIKDIESTNLLTYLALILAYVAYAWSVRRDFDSWKSLFISFKNDLEGQKSWLRNEYFEATYKDKTSFHPSKIIFPLSFESLPEIIRRGVAEYRWIPSIFIERLSLFNERVIAFNSFLDHIKRIISSDPIATERLIDKLNDMGVEDNRVEFDDFKNKIRNLKKTDADFYLAENIRRLNRAIHVKLIGNKGEEDRLHFLYTEIIRELENIIIKFDNQKPFFIKYKWFLIVLSVPLFLVIETFLK
mgnify:FL=1